MGTNGVGKTSLLKAISGVHHRSGGDYSLAGETIGRLPAISSRPRAWAMCRRGATSFLC
jgi:ABC-type branched-subunit amino acid transport system ATPase component